MTLIRFVLSCIAVYFVMQLDSYLYFNGYTVFQPFVQQLVAILLVSGIFLLYCRTHVSLRLTKESAVIILAMFLYMFTQFMGIATWDNLPQDLKNLFLWKYLVVLLPFGVVLGMLLRDKTSEVFFVILVAFFMVMSVDVLFGSVSEGQTSGRMSATLSNPNMAASVIVCLMIASFRWTRLGLLEVLSVIVAGACILMTLSRGGMVTYIVAVMCFMAWWIWVGRTSNIRINRFFLASILSIVVIGVMVAMLFAQRYGVDSVGEMKVATFSNTPGRTHSVDVAINLIGEKPLLGHGTGFVFSQELGPHNMLLRAWVENGILGLFGMIALFFGLLWFGIVRKEPGIITLAIILSVVSMVSHNLTEERSILIIIGMMLGSSSGKLSTLTSDRVIRHNRLEG